LASALYLAGEDRITLRELLDGSLDLGNVRLAVLSACQTGLIDFQRVPDEVVGLPAGLLQAGVPAVISTLWPVDDLATTLLMDQFYRLHLKEHLEPAVALHEAQQWLRGATAAEMALMEHYAQQFQSSRQNDTHAWQMMRYYRKHPDVKPYTHSYYWAAFVYTGV
jgi:CHAT domain-containing protein